MTSALQAELIGRARGLRGLLVDKASEAEAMRRVHPDVFDALREAELWSLGPPAELGGHDVDLDTMFEVAYELGRGCASTGWVWTICTLHSWFLAFASSQAQGELLSGGPDVLITTGYNPVGATAQPADGGCLVSGKWGFSSGVDYADWVLVAATLPWVPRPPDAPGFMMLVPRDQVTIVDDWFVTGMKSTGSKGIAIDEPVFVPEHRYLDLNETENGPAKTRFGRASYGVPNSVSIQHVVSAPFLGAARSALDDLSEQMKTRRASFTNARKAESVGIQMRIGEAAAEIDAALSLARADLTEVLEFGVRGEVMTKEQRATHRLHHAYCLLLARRAITRLFEVSGTPGMFQSSPLQRIFSDVYAASKHFAFNWDEYAESYGRVRLGLEPNATLV